MVACSAKTDTEQNSNVTENATNPTNNDSNCNAMVNTGETPSEKEDYYAQYVKEEMFKLGEDFEIVHNSYTDNYFSHQYQNFADGSYAVVLSTKEYSVTLYRDAEYKNQHMYCYNKNTETEMSYKLSENETIYKILETFNLDTSIATSFQYRIIDVEFFSIHSELKEEMRFVMTENGGDTSKYRFTFVLDINEKPTLTSFTNDNGLLVNFLLHENSINDKSFMENASTDESVKTEIIAIMNDMVAKINN